jgi:hypothetical protein
MKKFLKMMYGLILLFSATALNAYEDSGSIECSCEYFKETGFVNPVVAIEESAFDSDGGCLLRIINAADLHEAILLKTQCDYVIIKDCRQTCKSLYGFNCSNKAALTEYQKKLNDGKDEDNNNEDKE